MHPKNLKIEKFTYDLPEGKIARFPLPERDASKLLLFDQGKLSQDIYKNLAHYLPQNSLLVFNDTKVVEARLVFQKDTGGIIEIFCLEPDQQYSDITTAMLQKGKVYWQCLIGGASKWKSGQILEKKIKQEGSNFLLKAKITDRLPDCFIIELSWEPDYLSFAEMLHKKVRTEYWAYEKAENLTNEQLIKEEYTGIRRAPGYPACPDHTEKYKLFHLLGGEKTTGITLTESLAMYPASSVSGWYFAHPDSKYFGIGKINRDQVEDYARRKNMTVEDTERWLRPVLEYDS